MFIITAAAAGMMAAGCTPSGENYYHENVFLLTSNEEVGGGVTTLTTYDWSEKGIPQGELCKVNGRRVYQDTDYVPDEENFTVTSTRTYYDEAGQPGRQETRVRQYYSANLLHLIGLKVYDAGNPANTTPLSSWENIYTDNILTAYEERVNGVPTLVYDGYSFKTLTTSYDITDNRSGETVEQKNVTTYTDSSKSFISNIVVYPAGSEEEMQYTEYSYEHAGSYYKTSYIKYNTTYEAGKQIRTPAEKLTNYSNSNNTIRFDTITYEEDGETEKSKTSTTRVYKTISNKVYF